MTRDERVALEASIERYEGPIVAAARAAGRLPVIDCTARKYPATPAQLDELRRFSDPTARERIFRDSTALRRKASSLRSLASVLDRDGKPDQAEAMRAKAQAHEARADADEESIRA